MKRQLRDFTPAGARICTIHARAVYAAMEAEHATENRYIRFAADGLVAFAGEA